MHPVDFERVSVHLPFGMVLHRWLCRICINVSIAVLCVCAGELADCSGNACLISFPSPHILRFFVRRYACSFLCLGAFDPVCLDSVILIRFHLDSITLPYLATYL